MAAKKKKKTMKTLQKNVDLTVEQLAAIIKKLSPEDRERLEDLTYEVPAWQKKIVQGSIEKARKDPRRLVPWEETKRMLKSRK